MATPNNDDGGNGAGGDAIGGTNEDDGDGDDEDEDEDDDVSCGHVLYAVAISCAGEHTVEPNTRLLMGIYTGWIFFVFLLAEIYTADLVALLTTAAPLDKAPWTTMADCQQQRNFNGQMKGCNFCTQKGAANDQYFQEESNEIGDR